MAPGCSTIVGMPDAAGEEHAWCHHLADESGDAMTERKNASSYVRGAVYRIVWGSAGLLCLGLAICIVFYGVVGLSVRVGVGALLVVLGVDAVWSALHSKESWLARIFPFI